MKWVIFLHFYQPHYQQFDILERIVNESYRPILDIFKKNRRAKMTVNLNAGLLELLEQNGYEDVIRDIKFLAERGQLEFTGTAKYHAFLPLLPEKEIKRQIEINTAVSRQYLGEIYQPQGFFSPELAYSFKVAKIAQGLGFQWILADEIASPQKQDFAQIFNISGLKNFKILFRDKRMSVLILSAIIRNLDSLKAELTDDLSKKRYLLTVMDAETFGHHRPGLEKFLETIYQAKFVEKVKITELIDAFSTHQEINPRESTWSSEEQDFWLAKEKDLVKSSPFILWQHPQNQIHQRQWAFTYFVIDLLEQNKNLSNAQFLREKLDRALSSDQYWWASAQPWWSLEMIEQGAYNLKEIVFSLVNHQEEKEKAEKYYQEILSLAFDWQRSGRIRQAYRQVYQTETKVLFKDRTPVEWYNLIILEFEDEMKKAAEKQEFEKAIKWRDAIDKLKSGADIYDVLHVVDDLRLTRQLPSLKSFYEHSIEEFSDLAKKSFKDFSENDFQQKQPEELKRMIAEAFKKRNSHPLGFHWDKNNNFYLSEFPGTEIKFYLNEGWNSFSQLHFPRKGRYQKKNQCLYDYGNNRVKIILTEDSFLSWFINFLKNYDWSKGKNLRLAVLMENFGWAPIFFKKNNGLREAIIPYSPDLAFKFRISGFQTKKEERKVKSGREVLIKILGRLIYYGQKLIFYLKK